MCAYIYVYRKIKRRRELYLSGNSTLVFFSLSPFPTALGDETHKIPISGFHLPRSCYAVVLRELIEFAQRAQPRFFCRVWSRSKL